MFRVGSICRATSQACRASSIRPAIARPTVMLRCASTKLGFSRAAIFAHERPSWIDQLANTRMPFRFGPNKFVDRGDLSVIRLRTVLWRHIRCRGEAVHTRSNFVQGPDLDRGLWPVPVGPLPPPFPLRTSRGRPQLPQAPLDHLYQVERPVSPAGEPPLHLQRRYSSQTPTFGASN